jgi:hypothetical protein
MPALVSASAGLAKRRLFKLSSAAMLDIGK